VAGKHPEQKVGEIQKVVLYSRVGYSISDEDDESRLSAQESVMRKFCKQHNLEIKSEHREIASGILDLWSRPVLDKALNEIKWSRKEKSVILVTHISRLSKSCDMVWKLLDCHNPKFLAVSSGMNYHQFPMQIQAAVAEEDFRLKYGSTACRTTPVGYKEFARRFKEGIEAQLKYGMTLKEIAEHHEKFNIPLPWDWHWEESTIKKMMDLWEK
jgi:hypothetical protein